MMTHYATWTPATDTREIPALLRGHPPTVELDLLDLRPAVEPTVRFARLRRAADATLMTAGIVAAAILCTRGAAYLAVLLTGGIQ